MVTQETDTIKIHLIEHSSALKFIKGGNALFTVRSLKTQQRLTFKILKDRNEEGKFKVYVLNGSDNTRNYRLIGILDSNSPFLQSTSVHVKELPCFIAFDYIYSNLCIGKEMPLLEIWHEGRCCRCGRVLTVPESIAMGIGPECAFK